MLPHSIKGVFLIKNKNLMQDSAALNMVNQGTKINLINFFFIGMEFVVLKIDNNYDKF